MMKSTKKQATSCFIVLYIIIQLQNIWNKIDEEATEWIYSILETKQCNETRKSI